MDWYWYVVIIAAITALIAILLFALALYAHRLVFGRRINRNINLKYFSAEDFSLTVRKLPVTFDKTPLYAAVYTLQPEETCKKVVLFCHGIGAGHAPYMTEIAKLASFGYAVVAYDSIGCGMSQGKNARGFYANVQCATAAYIAIKGDALSATAGARTLRSASQQLSGPIQWLHFRASTPRRRLWPTAPHP